MHKVLLLGKDGQVGYELQRSLPLLGEVMAYGRSQENGVSVDLTDIAGLESLIARLQPDVIVNAAAYTAVDQAEADTALAFQVNATAPAAIAHAAKACGAWLVHYSTDYVFDGSGETARDESSVTAPLSAYGRSKLAGEEAIRDSNCKHLIFRTSWVHSIQGNNFIRTILRLSAEREQLKVVNDQIGSPTAADLIADVTAHALREVATQKPSSGIYHLCAEGTTSWHGLACFVVNLASKRGRVMRIDSEHIEPIPSSDYPLPAQRPLNSRLDCSKLKVTFGINLPSWESGVARTVHGLIRS